jgi:Modulator of levamisole receptor-1
MRGVGTMIVAIAAQFRNHLVLAQATNRVDYVVRATGSRATKTTAWLPMSFPNPDDESTCHNGGSKRLCDPDSILSQSDLSVLTDALNDTPSRKITLDVKCVGQAQNNVVEAQYGVAVIKKVPLRGGNVTVQPWLVSFVAFYPRTNYL